jgi:maltose O-acetyltransferase
MRAGPTPGVSATRAPAGLRKVVEVAGEELGNVDARVVVARALMSPIPTGLGNRLRASILRCLGYRVGPGTTMMDRFVLIGGRGASTKLTIGQNCFISAGCVFDATAAIEIGDDVAIGAQVLITTSSHDLTNGSRRSGAIQGRPVLVGPGAWIAARAVLLPGITVGEGAVVGAGAVVTRSVPRHTIVGGVPAREIDVLTSPSSR